VNEHNCVAGFGALGVSAFLLICFLRIHSDHLSTLVLPS
jgi:hypothetical protein